MKRINIESLSLSIIDDDKLHEVYFVDSNTNCRINTLPIELIEFINKIIETNRALERFNYINNSTIDEGLKKLGHRIRYSYKSGSHIILKYDSYRGVIAQNSKIVVPFKYYGEICIDEKYNHIRIDHVGRSDGSYCRTLMDINGKLLLENFSQIGEFSEGYSIVRGPILVGTPHGKLMRNPEVHAWGVMDEKLKITPIEYRTNSPCLIECNKIEPFKKGFAYGVLYSDGDGGEIYLINTKGEIVIGGGGNIEIGDSLIFTISKQYTGIFSLTGEYLFGIEDPYYQKNWTGWQGEKKNETENIYVIRASKVFDNDRNKKWGYINTSYEEVIPFIYDEAGLMINGVAKIKLNDKYGLINSGGKLLVAPVYDMIGQMRYNKHLLVNIGGKVNDKKKVKGGLYGLLSIEGELLTQIGYDGIQEIGETGYVKIKKGKLFGMVDVNGKEIIPCVYNSIQTFNDGLCPVNEGGEAIEKNGHRVFSGGKWGFVNEQGEKIIELKFDFARNLHNGLAAVKIENKYGFVDKNGTVIIPPQFDSVGDFSSDDKAQVCIGDLHNLIDKNGAITKKWEKSAKKHEDYIEHDWDEERKERDRDTWYALTGSQYGDYPDGEYNEDSLRDSLGM